MYRVLELVVVGGQKDVGLFATCCAFKTLKGPTDRHNYDSLNNMQPTRLGLQPSIDEG